MYKEENHRLAALRLIAILGLAAVLVIGLGACTPAETPTPEPTEEPTAEPTEPPPPDYSAQQAAWESGPHYDNWGEGKGPNDMCSRCHSPQNWRTDSSPGPPPNCISCKFPTDEEVRDASPFNIFVPEEDWVGIPCETCHSFDGETITGIAWLNPVTGEHEPANTSNELCAKCHVNIGAVSHGITLGGDAHTNYAGQWPQGPRPQYCSDCHNPMSTAPMACEDCHTEVLSLDTHPRNTRNGTHTIVTCMACHDAEGYDSGPHPDEAMGGLWVTQETTFGRGGPSTDAVISHSPQLDVSCDRCHFADNTNGLIVLTADGEVPEPEPEAEGE
jgi:hypothetical protein